MVATAVKRAIDGWRCPSSGVDEGVATTLYQDADGDTYGNAAVSAQACTQPAGYILDSSDCDDNDPFINPLAAEICKDREDNDCDGGIDKRDPEGCLK